MRKLVAFLVNIGAVPLVLLMLIAAALVEALELVGDRLKGGGQ